MNAITLTHSLESLRDNGLVTLYGKPNSEDGPIAFIFEPAATHPDAEYHETFAAAATLSQKGTTLALFKGVAINTMNNLLDRTNEQEERDMLMKLPQVSNYEELGQAFGIFYLLCWKLAWEAMEKHIPVLDDFVNGDWLQSLGYLQIIHSGLLNHVERQFFHRSLPDSELRGKVLQKHYAFTTLCHPYGIHPLSSLFVGMGYKPNLEEEKKALGLTYIHRDVVNEVNIATALYWAAKNNDTRLASFRL
ncbi:MAG: hypothetical protein DI585_01320 [Pseudomonas fluorescens]|nr:MAG: hypothetical protein DI585_01320 [Pseudomonas fluorescens]